MQLRPKNIGACWKQFPIASAQTKLMKPGISGTPHGLTEMLPLVASKP